MAHSVSALARARQNERARIFNKSIKREIITHIKKLHAAIEGDQRDAATQTLNLCVSKLDKAQKKGVLHKNTVANRKSLLFRHYNAKFGAKAS